jgi:hypothetical protein
MKGDSSFIACTGDSGETWDVYLCSFDKAEHVVKLVCAPEVAEVITDLLNKGLGPDKEKPLVFGRAFWQRFGEEWPTAVAPRPPVPAAPKRGGTQRDAMFLLGVLYTLCESRIDPSHPAFGKMPDWGALAYLLRHYLVKNDGDLRAPLPFRP